MKKQKLIWVPRLAQSRAVKKALKGSIALFLQPGLGKTTIILEIFRRLKRKRQVKRMLVIAPLNPCYLVWTSEIRKWQNFCHFRWTILHGFGKERRLHWKPADIYIINPAGLPWLEQQLGEDWSDFFQILAIDESTKFKSASSDVFKLLRRHLKDFKYRYPLTGTPCPEGIKDFYAQIYLVDRGESLGETITDFMNMYFITEIQHAYVKGKKRYFPVHIPKKKSRKKILKKIRNISVTMLTSDYLDLPPVVDNLVRFKLPNNIELQYKKMVNKLFIEWQNEEFVADSAGEKYAKLKQITFGFMYNTDELTGKRSTIHLHNCRAEALCDLLDEIGRPCLLAYNHTEDLVRLKKTLDKKIVVLNEAHHKKKVETAWNKGLIPVLAIQPKSGAHGLNLQFGGYDLIWYNITTSGEDFEQMALRLKRPGTEAASIFQHFLIAKGTIDEESYDVMTNKVDYQNSTMVILKKYFDLS